MDVTIRDRTEEAPEATRSYLEERLRLLGRHFDLVRSADVELDQERQRSRQPLHVVEINLRLVGPRLEGIRARETGRDLKAAVDLALDKIDEEIVELKERVRPHP